MNFELSILLRFLLLPYKFSLGAAIFFNAYPDIKDKRNWERRCGCIATFFCCKRQISRHPDGKTPPLKNIAELTAGLLSHCDLDASDIAAAIILTSAAQQRRRRLKIASALVPLIEELQRNPDPHFARQLQQCRQLMSRDSFPNMNGESCEGLDDDDSVEDENIDGVPCDQALTERLKRTQTDVRSPSIDAQAQSDPDEAQLRVDVLTASRESILQECVQQDTVSTSTSNPQALDQLAEVVREELEQLGASPAGEAVLALEQVCEAIFE